MLFRTAIAPADDPDAEPVIREYEGVDFYALKGAADAELPDGWIRLWIATGR